MARLSIRIDMVPQGRIGPGKIALLEGIDKYGSIAAAGRSLGMSYRRAWELVAETAGLLGAAVVITQTGGKRGGAATLTPLGQEAVRRYRAAEAEASRAAARELEGLQKAADKAREAGK